MAKKLVKKKKMQFMMAKAKEAFNIVHVLLALTVMPVTVALKSPKVMA